jgi:hypothetical protein
MLGRLAGAACTADAMAKARTATKDRRGTGIIRKPLNETPPRRKR